jgi:concanavalin A-like lectin/glucanase superfamily protein/galactose oxidase-like protein/Kelch motif protein
MQSCSEWRAAIRDHQREQSTTRQAVGRRGEPVTASRPRPTEGHGGAIRVAVLIIAVSSIAAAGAVVAQSTDPAVVGQWSSTFTLPIIPIFSSQLTNGQVLMYDSMTDSTWQPSLLYPSTLSTTSVPYKPSPNLFCSDLTPLTDGRILVVGGHSAGYVGINNTTIFDPETNAWTDVTPMAYARWYPSLIKLPDGRMLVVSGAIDCSDCTNPNGSHTGIAPLPEIFDPRILTWSTISTASLRLPLYPHLFVLPDGRVFAAASQEDPMVSQVLDLTAGTWAAVDSPHKLDGGSSVMYRPGKVMKCGAARNPDYPIANAAATTYVIDMTQPSPTWRQTASMANSRTEHNLVLLPDGTVMANGGGVNSDVSNLGAAVLTAELWNPTTETWSALAPGQVPRLYHSVALLLPDGTVFAGGGGHPPGFGVEQYQAEIYSPPYLFKGPRPSITASPSVVGYGQSFFLQTPDGAGAASVALIAQGSVTHGFNSNQRYLSLSFTQTAGGLNVTAPANSNLAPPGYYMMFLVNGTGVPSVAAWLRLPASWEDGQAPTVPANLVASVSTGRVDLAWGASSDNIGVAGYDVFRSTTSGFSPGDSNRIARTTATSYSDEGMNSGTYYYLVRASDAAGNYSLSSNQVSASVVVDTTPPGATPAIAVVSSGPGQIGLGWSAATDDVGVADYRVERCVGSSCSGFAQVATTTGTAFDDLGLTAGTTYRYRVRAEDARGNIGAYSSVVSGTTSGPSGGLVAAWGFNEGTGATAADLSGFANNGTLAATGWTAGGKFGGALSFDGGNSMVTVADAASLDLTSAMTVEAWVDPSAASTAWKAIVDKNTDGYYLMSSSNSPGGVPVVGGTFVSGNVNVFAPQALPPGVWSHVAGTFDGARLRLYINGAEVANVSHADPLVATAANLQVGTDSYGETFQGTLDEIRIYNRALSAGEIQADMNTPVETGVVKFSVRKDVPTSSIVLSWTDSASNGTYRVRRATGPAPADFSSASCFVVQGTTFTDPTPAGNGVSYDYLVDAGSSCP